MASATTTALILHFTLLSLAHAATFRILNHCTYTIWPAAIPGGGRRLDPGQVWVINVAPGTAGGRIWARTGCSFNSTGIGGCLTGDCAGLLECDAFGSPPVTLVEFALNQFNNHDFMDISLVDGFNVPVNLIPTTGGCPEVRCEADITASCPAELRAPGGCNNPCTVFRTDEYCCQTQTANNCRPTNYSMFLKSNCPDAYSYPMDDATSTFNCTSGTDYTVAFCASSGGELATRFGRVSVRLVVPQVNA
ncbi:protein P21-like [Curcuma longa]|uniref:protein P21-like n=1 Tax=Curcuma longa TaxID=136217 RepID=UPI003D9DF1B7